VHSDPFVTISVLRQILGVYSDRSAMVGVHSDNIGVRHSRLVLGLKRWGRSALRPRVNGCTVMTLMAIVR
jgi:hypothetical protein